LLGFHFSIKKPPHDVKVNPLEDQSFQRYGIFLEQINEGYVNIPRRADQVTAKMTHIVISNGETLFQLV
jgi:hypothetical protein